MANTLSEFTQLVQGLKRYMCIDYLCRQRAGQPEAPMARHVAHLMMGTSWREELNAFGLSMLVVMCRDLLGESICQHLDAYLDSDTSTKDWLQFVRLQNMPIRALSGRMLFDPTDGSNVDASNYTNNWLEAHGYEDRLWLTRLYGSTGFIFGRFRRYATHLMVYNEKCRSADMTYGEYYLGGNTVIVREECVRYHAEICWDPTGIHQLPDAGIETNSTTKKAFLNILRGLGMNNVQMQRVISQYYVDNASIATRSDRIFTRNTFTPATWDLLKAVKLRIPLMTSLYKLACDTSRDNSQPLGFLTACCTPGRPYYNVYMRLCHFWEPDSIYTITLMMLAQTLHPLQPDSTIRYMELIAKVHTLATQILVGAISEINCFLAAATYTYPGFKPCSFQELRDCLRSKIANEIEPHEGHNSYQLWQNLLQYAMSYSNVAGHINRVVDEHILCYVKQLLLWSGMTIPAEPPSVNDAISMLFCNVSLQWHTSLLS